MALWRAKTNYQRLDSQSSMPLWKIARNPKQFLPYERLYKNLTHQQLLNLLQEARQFHWEVLDLRRCGLYALPDELGQLEDLRILALGNPPKSMNEGQRNAFVSISCSVEQLTNLQALSLVGTNIVELPDGIKEWRDLQSLDLCDTNISAFPNGIEYLKNLQTLNLSGTKVSKISDSIEALTNLKSLNLSRCHLKEIPRSVVMLDLPFVTNNIDANYGVNLSEITLQEGHLSLFEQSHEVIEAYYRGEEIKIRECKVIFLGDGATGKSSLVQRMVEGTYDPKKLPTDGVKTTFWKQPVGKESYKLRILDFGGQEIMHSMHRCFLTAHTIYVVVCESRDDTEIDSAAARWLETVNSFAPGCPVILALNKADLNANVSVNERDLKQRNPALKLVLKTSAKDAPDSKYGVHRLIDAVRDEIPNVVNDYKANADMLGVKLALEEMTEDYISSERYRKICTEHNITDEKLQYSLLGFFRDLGVAYYYESIAFDTRLESVRVLNPEWLTNGIYRLILRTRENGFLRHKTIKDTLRDAYAGDIHSEITYTPEETEYVLHVMRYFEISHDMGDGVEMIPLKMSKTPPNSVDKFLKKDALHLRWEGSYLPNNLIHRLLIRKFSELDINCVWRTGGHFHQTGGSCEALAEMNEKALDVYVNGDRDCRQYLETFRGVIRNILDSLNLKAEEMICHTVNGREGKVSYQAALSHLYNNKPEIYLANIDAYVSPVFLLKEIYVDIDRELARYRQQLRDAPPPSPEKAPEKAENPLDDEKTRAEIEQLKTEAKKNNVAVTLAVARALLIPALIVLAWVAGRSDFFEKLLEWLFSISIG